MRVHTLDLEEQLHAAVRSVKVTLDRGLPLLLLVILLLASPARLFSEPSGQDIVVGRSIELRSRLFGEDIRLLVTLPEDYHASEDRYPVLYTVQAFFLHTAGSVQQLSRGQIPKMIYVHVDTYDSGNLLPTKIEGRPSSGGADRFIEFFERELIPFIDAHYRTQPFRILQSGSWGGVFCLYTALTRPDVFNAHIAATPWLIYDGDEQYMLNHADSLLKVHDYGGRFLFMALGNDPDPGLHEGFETMTRIFQDHVGNRPRFASFYWEDEDHSSTQHKALYDGLKWIFEDWRDIPEEVLESGADAVREYRNDLVQMYGCDLGIGTAALGGFGMRCMQAGKTEQAIGILELRAEWSPDKPWAFEQLGRAYEAAGRLSDAKESFETAVRIAEEQSLADLTRYRHHVERVEKSLSGQTSDP
jgi:predicted alpha/beta superfamily hydrolase